MSKSARFHGFHIHEYGVAPGECDQAGSRLYELGEMYAHQNTFASFEKINEDICIRDDTTDNVLGKTVMVHLGEDHGT